MALLFDNTIKNNCKGHWNFNQNKMKIIYLIISFLILKAPSFAQGNRIWSTYYGGNKNEVTPSGGPFVATDNSGNVFMAGYTLSLSNIASGGFQNSFGGLIDAFLVKFDGAGNRLWATYYGGNSAEYIYGITTDALGNVYICGKTASTNNIASGGFQNFIGGGTFDAFLVKFDPNGNRLWSSYYGGSADDSGDGISVDALGNVYLTGTTASSLNISSGGFQNSFGGVNDAFLVKFNSSGNRIWASYYGGSSNDIASGSAIDGFGNIYISGSTGSSNNIASGGFQNSIGGAYDAFLVKFDSTGNRIWASYYGGSNNDYACSIITSASGMVYLAGYTNSTSGIAFSGFQNSFAGGASLGDAFLVKFDSFGNRTWGTYYGGPGEDYCLSIVADGSGNVYLGGDTYSSSGIASNGFQNIKQGTENEFIVKLDSNGNRLCATYFGASHDEDGHVAVDLFGNIYLTGSTQSTIGIASGGFQNTFGGGATDAYLAKFSSTCLNTGIEEEKILNSNSVYPNPSDGFFRLSIENEIDRGAIILINSLGQKVYEHKITNGQNNINTVNLPSGLYTYFIIRDEVQISNGKLIIE